jgi:hypothetical protein
MAESLYACHRSFIGTIAAVSASPWVTGGAFCEGMPRCLAGV